MALNCCVFQLERFEEMESQLSSLRVELADTEVIDCADEIVRHSQTDIE